MRGPKTGWKALDCARLGTGLLGLTLVPRYDRKESQTGRNLSSRNLLDALASAVPASTCDSLNSGKSVVKGVDIWPFSADTRGVKLLRFRHLEGHHIPCPPPTRKHTMNAVNKALREAVLTSILRTPESYQGKRFEVEVSIEGHAVYVGQWTEEPARPTSEQLRHELADRLAENECWKCEGPNSWSRREKGAVGRVQVHDRPSGPRFYAYLNVDGFARTLETLDLEEAIQWATQ